MKLYGRTTRLVIAETGQAEGLDLSGLDLSFDIKKTLKPDPNVAEISVYNMNPAHRLLFETAKTLTVEFHAGYQEGMSLLYLGEMRAAVTKQVGDEVITEIQSGDKHGLFAGKVIRVPVGPGGSVEDALKLLADAFGIGLGNLKSVMGKAKKGSATLFPVGGVLTGNVADTMQAICAGAGLEFSVQDGVLQILNVGAALEDEAILLGSDSGLIGSIEISNKGYLKCTSLLIPDIKPGRKIVFDTVDNLQGGYRIEKVRYTGHTKEHDWYAHIEAKQYT